MTKAQRRLLERLGDRARNRGRFAGAEVGTRRLDPDDYEGLRKRKKRKRKGKDMDIEEATEFWAEADI